MDAGVLEFMLGHPVFLQPPPKSLDRFDCPMAAVEGLTPEDGAATLTAFTAAAIARAQEHLPEVPQKWIICGGGRHNPVLMRELRTRLKQGKIYKPEKIEQALTNFFRKGNLSTLRELALRAVAEEVGSKAAQYRSREGLEPAPIPEKVMVCISSGSTAKRLLRAGARIAGRLAAVWYAVYVETPQEEPARIDPKNARQLEENFAMAEGLGATVVKLKARRAADGLIEFARREGISHVIFGQSARSRWDILLHGSVLNRFLDEVKDAAVQIIPTGKHGDHAE